MKQIVLFLLRSTIILLSVGALAGCQENGPPREQLIQSIQEGTPKWLNFELSKTEVLENSKVPPGMVFINFKGTISPNQPLYHEAETVDVFKEKNMLLSGSKEGSMLSSPSSLNVADPIRSNIDDIVEYPTFIRQVADDSAKEVVFGKCIAEKIVDKWNIKGCAYDFSSFSGKNKKPLIWKAKSKDSFRAYLTKPVIIVSSPEADAYFAKLAAKRKQRRDAIMPYVKRQPTYAGLLISKEISVIGRPKPAQETQIVVKFKSFSDDGNNVKMIFSIPSGKQQALFSSHQRKILDQKDLDYENYPLCMNFEKWIDPGKEVRGTREFNYEFDQFVKDAGYMTKHSPVYIKFDKNKVIGKVMASRRSYTFQADLVSDKTSSNSTR